MKNQWIKAGLATLILAITFSSCKKNDDAPVPDEQEVITTLRMDISGDAGFTASYIYKVENGFNNTTPGTVQADTIKLAPGKTYNVSLTVLNEKATPVEDITTEILEKNLEHLFVFLSTPATGNGSMSVSGGSKDEKGLPLNQTFKLSTGTSGSGSFNIHLMHQPTDKNGTTPATAGGETDLDATYPVLLQ